MDFRFTTEQEAWRQEVRRFLDENLPRQFEFHTDFEERDEYWDFAISFTKKVGDKGWLTLTWPKEYGGSERSRIEDRILWEEFDYRLAPVVNLIGRGLAAGTLLKFGTEAQKRRFLPPIARTESIWVEGLTEPDSGSDLASLQVRADRDGDSASQQMGVVWCPIRAPEEGLDDPHLQERGFWQPVEHPELGRTLLYPRGGWEGSATRWQVGPRAPLVGEHTVEVLRCDLGFSPRQVRELQRAGVI